MTMTTNHELVDALIDHEDVDVDALRRVLEAPEARDYLLDAHLLRRAMLAERTDSGDSSDAPRPVASQHGASRRFLLAAAMAAGLVCAFAAGRFTLDGGARAGQSVSVTEASANESVSFPAPAATRVIQIEFSPTSGGN